MAVSLNLMKIILLLFCVIPMTIGKEVKKTENEKENEDENEDEDEDSKDDDESKKDEEDEEEELEDSCNLRLLENFRLDGLRPKETPKEMTICKEIAASNNCCSEIDEIKILKTWNTFSEPKLHRFVKDMAMTYKKLLNLDPFIKVLDTKQIRYHYETFKWKKVKKQRCFSTSNFLIRTGFKEEAGKGGKFQNINFIQQFLDMNRNTIFQHFTPALARVVAVKKLGDVIKFFKQSATLQSYINNFSKDITRFDNFKNFQNLVLGKLTNMDDDDLLLKSKSKTENKTKFLTNTINFNHIWTVMTNNYLERRQVFELKEGLSKACLSTFEKIIKEEMFLGKDKQNYSVAIKNIVDDIVTRDRDLQNATNFIMSPEIFQEKNSNYKVWNYMEGLVTKHFTQYFSDSSNSVPGENNYYTLKKFIKNFDEKFEPSKFEYSYQKPIQKYLYVKLYTEYIEEIVVKAKLDKMDLKGRKLDARKKLTTVLKNFLKHIDKYYFTLSHSRFKNYNVLSNEIRKNAKKIHKQVRSGIPFLLKVFAGGFNPNFHSSFNAAVAGLNDIKNKLHFKLKEQSKSSQICAEVYQHNLFKEVHFNEKKLKHCSEIQSKLLKIDASRIYSNIEPMEQELKKMVDLKKSFYCSICDLTKTKYIDTEKNVITFSNQFCFDILTTFKEYLIWKNKDLIEYLSNLFQYLKCFETDGSLQTYPYKFFGQDHLKFINKIVKCTKLTKPENVGDCIQICEKFDFVHYSHFFDGEKKFMERMYDYIINIIRIFGFRFKIAVKQLPVEKKSEASAKTNINIDEISKEVQTHNNKLLKLNPLISKMKLEDIILNSKEASKKVTPKQGRILSEKYYSRWLTEKQKKEIQKSEEKKEKQKKEEEEKKLKGKDLIKFLLLNPQPKNFTRKAHTKHDEINHGEPNNKRAEKNINFRTISKKITLEGLNPLETLKMASFDPGLGMSLWKAGKEEEKNEILDKNVVKDYVVVEKIDVENFNENVNFAIDDDVKVKEEDKGVKSVNKEVQGGEARKLRKKKRRKRRLRRRKLRKGKVDGKNTIMNFLFKLLF